MFSLASKLNLLLKKEQRYAERQVVAYSVACRPEKFSYSDHKGLLGSEEMLTKTEDISNTGMCIKWPCNFKCHFCKHRIDVGTKASSCEIGECNFEMTGFKVGSNMLVTLQVKGRVIEDIKTKIVWYEEPKTSQNFYGRVGVKFYQPLELG